MKIVFVRETMRLIIIIHGIILMESRSKDQKLQEKQKKTGIILKQYTLAKLTIHTFIKVSYFFGLVKTNPLLITWHINVINVVNRL